MMIRPVELAAIKRGEIDLAFRRWDRPRVKVGTRLRTAVGLLEVTSVEQVAVSSLRAEDARRAGTRRWRRSGRLSEARAERPLFRVGLRYAGADPRRGAARAGPDGRRVTGIRAWLDRSRPGVDGRSVDAGEPGDHRSLPRRPRAGARRRARPRDAGVEARRAQAQGEGSDRVAGHRLPALAPGRGGARPRRPCPGPRAARGRHAPAAQHRGTGHPRAARRGP